LNVLIVYGTTEGQTRKIAEWTAMHIRESGHEAELLDGAALKSDLDLETYDAFIIAATLAGSMTARNSGCVDSPL